MRTTRIVSLLASLFVASVPAASASGDQEALLKVKALYAAAAYEDALAVLAAVPAETRLPELDQYRAFCLIALGDQQQAQAAIERLLTQDPLYQPDTSDTSPRVIEAFKAVRLRVLPIVTKKLYSDAKLALERKERSTAIARFETLLKFIGVESTNDPTLDDMKVLAEGFLDLSRALPEAPPAEAAARDNMPATSANGEAARAAVPTWTRPVIVRQDLPRWLAPDAISRRTAYDGILRVKVAADGKVVGAELVRRTHPIYDGQLLRAAENWVYEPARQNGVPVPSELLVEVRLRPEE